MTHYAASSEAMTPVFDQLNKIRLSLNALAALLNPIDHLGDADRGELAMLLSLLDEQAEDNPSQAGHARTAVVDLIGSPGELDCVSREHLHALVDLLAQMQTSAMAPLVHGHRTQ